MFTVARLRLFAASLLAASLIALPSSAVANRSPGQIIADYTVSAPGYGPLRYDAAHNLLWTIDVGNGQLIALAPQTGQIVRRTQLPATLPAGEFQVEIGLGMVWVTNFNDGNPAPLFEVDPTTGAIVNGGGYSTYGNGPDDIAFLGGNVWVSNHRQDAPGTSGSVVELDPTTGQQIRHVPIGAIQLRSGPDYMTTAAGSVWVEVPNLSAIVRLTPTASGGWSTDTIPVGSPAQPFNMGSAACGPLVSDSAGHVFFSDGGCQPSGLGRIDTTTERVTEWPEEGSVYGLASGLGAIWAGLAGEGMGRISTFLAQVDPGTGAILGKTMVDNQAGPSDVQVDPIDGLVFVRTFSGQLVAVQP